METRELTADELIDGTGIAARVIAEYPDVDESALDAALDKAYLTSSSVETWEARTRELLGINHNEEK